ncbi:ISL3 family transposase [Nesterenkonia cremea]|uniref:ISL3 family transposase n=1 Tax=Nesterenkonia cremea TaxID=1882340 RepID=A0A917AWV7_9MICC|nr:ISL3 family transposase [Nesterenkonia cremea]GGE78264.1 ISL3 family transposase [Nesterenkonia cremea]
MSENTCPVPACPADQHLYCHNCDLFADLDGLHVIAVQRPSTAGRLQVVVESASTPMGCPDCGVIAISAGRKSVDLIDAPVYGIPARLRWRKRRWRCVDPGCARGVFTEQNLTVAAPRALLTRRCIAYGIMMMRRENLSVQGLARQMGVDWHTAWRAIGPVLAHAATDEHRFAGVTTLGVDEHIWHHVNPARRGPKELTGMVDLTRNSEGRVQARLLDLVPGRSGTVYAEWLAAGGPEFRTGIQIAPLDPFAGYKNAIDAQLTEATAVLDAFHVVKLGTQAVDEVRRRVQQQTLGHRGRKGDPLYGIRRLLQAGIENLSQAQCRRIEKVITADPRHEEVFIAFQCAQELRSAYQHHDLSAGRRIALKVLESFSSCPVPEIAKLGRTLRRWRSEFLAYFTTDRSNNGGTEAVNGLIELARRIARGFRNRSNYRLRILLIARGLDGYLPT